MKIATVLLSFALAGNAFGSFMSGTGVACEYGSQVQTSNGSCFLGNELIPMAIFALTGVQGDFEPSGNLILRAYAKAHVYPNVVGSSLAIAWDEWSGYLVAESGTRTQISLGPQIVAVDSGAQTGGFASYKLIVDGKTIYGCSQHDFDRVSCSPYQSDFSIPLNTRITFRIEAVGANYGTSQPQQPFTAGLSDTGKTVSFVNNLPTPPK